MMTIVGITFNQRSKQYSYLFNGDKKQLECNTRYKLGSDSVYVVGYFEANRLPLIVTSALTITDSKNKTIEAHKLSAQELAELRK